MANLGYSLYLSTFTAQCSALRGQAGTGAPVFLSLHISEEFDDTFCDRAREACHALADMGYRIIADVSVKTVDQFGCTDLTELAEKLRLWALRIDYGFSREAIEAMAEKMAEHGIAVRAGLHCAPLAHTSAGTAETGTVRISFGHDAEKRQIMALAKAFARI